MKRASARTHRLVTIEQPPSAERSKRRVSARKPSVPSAPTSVELETAILRARKAHPQWGPQKIRAALERAGATAELPAASTVDTILKRAGSVPARRVSGRPEARAWDRVEATEPNDVWSIRFPPRFELDDGTRCHPLTVTDVFSRAPLVCRALPASSFEEVRSALETAFRSFGLPRFVLGENAVPFGSRGLGRVSRLGAWLLRYGVRPLFIDPQQALERARPDDFDELLLAASATAPRESLRAQQQAFHRFRTFYSDERAHSALGTRVPATVYVRSPRAMPTRMPEHTYPQRFETRRIRRDGSIKWTGGYAFFGEAMAHQLIGLVPLDEGRWHVFLGRMPIGLLHERSRTVLPLSAADEVALVRASDAPEWQDLREVRATRRPTARRPIRVRDRKKR